MAPYNRIRLLAALAVARLVNSNQQPNEGDKIMTISQFGFDNAADANKIIGAAKSTIETLNNAVSLVGTATLKDAKLELTTAKRHNAQATDGTPVMMMTAESDLFFSLGLDTIIKLRAKADFIAECERRASCLQASIESVSSRLVEFEIKLNLEAQDAMSEEELAQDVEGEQVLPYLEQIAIDIKDELEALACSTINIGKYLSEAREEFENQKEFLVWTKEQFDIGKTQAFSLMKIHRELGDIVELQGLSIKVLKLLLGQPLEVVEAVKEAVQSGETVTGNVAANMIAELSQTDQETDKLDIAETAPKVETLGSTQVPQNPVNEAPAATNEQETQLKEAFDTIAELSSTIKELSQKLEESKRKVKQKMPLLPQFKSANLHIRLGIESDATTSQVRAAYRTLAVHFNQETNSHAYTLITEARNLILAAMEA